MLVLKLWSGNSFAKGIHRVMRKMFLYKFIYFPVSLCEEPEIPIF